MLDMCANSAGDVVVLLPVKQSVDFMQKLQSNNAWQERIKGVLVDDTGDTLWFCLHNTDKMSVSQGGTCPTVSDPLALKHAVPRECGHVESVWQEVLVLLCKLLLHVLHESTMMATDVMVMPLLVPSLCFTCMLSQPASKGVAHMLVWCRST